MIDCSSEVRGLRLCELSSEELSVSVIPQFGGLIWSIEDVSTGTQFLYHHYKEPRPFSSYLEDFPRTDPIHTFFVGGWFEVLPNAGYSTNFAGTSWGLHGETVYIPWEVQFDEERDPLSLLTLAKLNRYPMKLYRRLSVRGRELIISERLVNLSPVDLKFSWLHHPTFGGNFLDENVRIEVEETEIVVDNYLNLKYGELEPGYRGKWPRARTKDGRVVDLSSLPRRGTQNTNDVVYIPKVNRGKFRIENLKKGVEIEFDYDPSIFPSLWIWRPIGGGPEDPWYGTIYATSLEITTSWPATGLAHQIEMGTASTLRANSSISTQISVRVTGR
jgi:hypothetical protein